MPKVCVMVSKLRRMGGDFGDFIPELLLEGFVCPVFVSLFLFSFGGEWEGGGSWGWMATPKIRIQCNQ